MRLLTRLGKDVEIVVRANRAVASAGAFVSLKARVREQQRRESDKQLLFLRKALILKQQAPLF